MRKLILKCPLSPGDVCTLSIAVHSLRAQYPGKFAVDVRTPCNAIFDNNPDVFPVADDDPEAESIDCHYPLIQFSGERPVNFSNGYTRFLGAHLNVPLEAISNRPRLYLSEAEKTAPKRILEATGGKDIPYAILNAGVKPDYTAKQWPVESYQDVIDATRGRIQWVQIGESCHLHPSLKGVIDLRGKTSLRELILLVYHSCGGLGPVTLLQHLCAAWQKPYLCLLGGREPTHWVHYPLQHTFHTIGLLPCCQDAACWRSRVVKSGDGDEKDNSLCELPVLGLKRPVAKCMALISPNEVIGLLNRILLS